MIDLSRRNFPSLAKDFYENIKTEVIQRLSENKKVFNNLVTDKSKLPLHKYLVDNLESILSGELDVIRLKFESELKNVFKRNYTNHKKRPSAFRKAIDNIFFYGEYDKWGAYTFAKRLGINTCPYCNRSYISPIGSDNEPFFRGDYDHFLSKKDYPYFRLSFYNLIPSCVVCNQRAKGAKPTDLDNFIYPYKEGFSKDATFSFLPNSYKGIIGQGGPKIYLKVLDEKSAKGKRVNSNIKLFRLNEQYSVHTIELERILKIKEKGTVSYIDSIRKLLPNAFKDQKEAYEFIFRNYYSEEDYEKQPLSKFTKDIVEEIGLLK